MKLFTKIQLPTTRPEIWSFQGSRETAGLARKWIDKMMVPIIQNLYSHPDNKRKPEEFRTMGRIQGKRVISLNDPS